MEQPEPGGIFDGVDVGDAQPVAAFAVGHDVKGRQAHDDLESRNARMNPVDDLSHEPGPVLEAAAEASFALMRAKQFVPEVSVAMLDVDELESRLGCTFCSGNEV